MSAYKGSPYDCTIESVENLDKGNWIQTRKINYKDPAGTSRVWEMAVRTTRTATTNIDAVCIVTILHKPGHPKEIVLVKQFRPPTGKVMIELPAGLVDPRESIETTAVRELLEETGYHGTFKSQSIDVFSDPGLTNANMVLAYVDVDLEDERNKHPKPQLEDSEFIDTITLPLKTLLVDLEALMKTEGCSVDSRLYHMAIGLQLAQ